MEARRIEVVGIGCGSPGLLTLDAVEAIGRVDVMLSFEKRAEVADLARVRDEILEQHGRPTLRRVAIADDVRTGSGEYATQVADWHQQRAAKITDVLCNDVRDSETAGILVWGDPSLYDSVLRLLDAINSGGRLRLDMHVVPGISSPQLLAARFGIALNQIGSPLVITTGRQLRDHGFPPGATDVVVMLDSDCVFTRLTGRGLQLYWGAYLGMPNEILRHGALDDIAASVAAIRAEARRANGWMFDVYLLRSIVQPPDHPAG